ncbi:MAG TPA: hypothetical protein G4O03_07425 [Dehalococcoidia bacterium]|jgi:hypothetical protein|nr:hypothetical protein [Dehalococcoidia bacterium]
MVKDREEPFGLSGLIEFIETILSSMALEGHDPLSAIIAGLPDTGKTEALLQYDATDGICVATDLTGYGLSRFLRDIQIGRIRYFIIPDFSKLLRGRGKAGDTVVSALISLCEEGIYNLSTFHQEFYSQTPVKCGFLAALTIDSYQTWRKEWRSLGFMSRLIPFLLGYNQEDIDGGLKTIRAGRNPFSKKALSLANKVTIGITDSQLDQVERIAKFTATLNRDFTAFRSFKNMIGFVKSHAIVRGDDKVTAEDIAFLRACVPFWCDPAGDDAQFFIIRHLPATVNDLVSKLSYSQSLVYNKLRELTSRRLVNKDKITGLYHITY